MVQVHNSKYILATTVWCHFSKVFYYLSPFCATFPDLIAWYFSAYVALVALILGSGNMVDWRGYQLVVSSWSMVIVVNRSSFCALERSEETMMMVKGGEQFVMAARRRPAGSGSQEARPALVIN